MVIFAVVGARAEDVGTEAFELSKRVVLRQEIFEDEIGHSLLKAIGRFGTEDGCRGAYPADGAIEGGVGRIF